MALMHVHFFSNILGVNCAMDVIIPERNLGIGLSGAAANSPAQHLPVLYLLHGLSDDQTIWQRRTSIERYVAGKNLAVVMPAVNRSFYTDQKCGYRYWTFISNELPALVSQFFHVSERREDTFAAGLSMGGYGALKLGLRRPDRFAAVASLSGAVDLSSFIDDPARGFEGRMTFGSLADYRGSADDLSALAAQTAAAGNGPKPRIFMACGTADFLYQDNIRFLPRLRQLGYDLTWTEKPGATHEWGYWDEMIQQVLAWLPL